MYTAAPAAPIESPAQRATFYTSKAHDFAQRAAASLTDAGRAYNSEQAAKYLRFAAWASSQSAPVEAIATGASAQPEPGTSVAAPVAAAVDVAPVKPEPTPTAADACRVRIMRAFFGTAKRAGLNCKAREAMTAALSKYLGCTIPSRASLSAGHWAEALAAVELGLLAW